MTDAESETDPADLEEWRRHVKDGSYKQASHQSLVAAVQDLGPLADARVLNPLMLEISDRMMRILRKHIGRNHRDEGEEAIAFAHEKLLQAALKPASADGRALRKTFVSTVKSRAADAIRREQLRAARFVELDDDDAATSPGGWTEPDVEGHLYVAAMLSRIEDPDKRLAFRLFVDGATRKSIAAALGVSTKTAEKWIADAKIQLNALLKVDHDA
nr:helix-turn-helix domain-containing protein [uncultured Dongia sp.]